MYEKIVIVSRSYALTESTFYLLRKQTTIDLNHTQFNKFINNCNTPQAIPKKLKEMAQLLDKEGF